MPWMTIPIALGLTAAGSTAAQIYSQKSANKTNRRAMEASERSETRAVDLEREALVQQLAEAKAAREAELAEKKAAREATLQRDRERWQDYLRVNEPMWRAGSDVLGSLYDLAGYGRSSAPAFSMPGPEPPSAGAGVAPPPVSMPLAGQGVVPDVGNGRSPAMAGPGPSALATARRARRPIVAPAAPQGVSLANLMAMASQGGGFGTDRVGRTIGS